MLKVDDVIKKLSVIHDINVIQIDNMWCIMLPPKGAALIQPLDQDIIALVNAQYRAWFLGG